MHVIYKYWCVFQESSTLETSCVVKVDEYGFFIYWKSDGKVGNVFVVYITNFDWHKSAPIT